jgi:hypothetical protein
MLSLDLLQDGFCADIFFFAAFIAKMFNAWFSLPLFWPLPKAPELPVDESFVP